MRKIRNVLKYQVSWIGYDPDPKWYPAFNFIGLLHKIRDFHANNLQLLGPFRRLAEWITAWESGQEDYDHLADDRA